MLPSYWIDPDAIAQELREKAALGAADGEPITENQIQREAFREARNRRVDFAEQGLDFGFETVFSHGSNLAFLRALKKVGYDVHLYFVATEDAAINIDRVAARVKLGGHAVPEQKIRERYERSLLLLSLAIPDCNRVFIFDNSQAPYSREGGPIRVVG
jgi:predicted ABC-type ATPase